MASRGGPLLVTAALILKGDQVLIAQRKPDSAAGGGKWEFPGGKVECGEHPEQSLVREIKEELNLEISVDRFHDLVSHVYELGAGERLHVVLLFYISTWIGGELELLDVADARWVRLKELGTFDFAEADIPVVKRILGNPDELLDKGAMD